MITYQYSAITRDGAKTKGVIQAVDEFAAVEKIKATCPIVEKITPVKEKTGFLAMEIGHKKINHKALAVMCSQFGIILKSGVSIARCMEMIGGQTTDKVLKKMLLAAAEDVEQGNGVARSFEKNCPELPITFIETIRAGEQSGTLENSFETLEKYYEKSYKTGQKIKQAMAYPIFVIIVAIIVLIVVMVKVVPSLVSSFADLGGDLPAMTALLIAMSDFFAKWWLVMIGVLIAIVIGVKVYITTENGRIGWNKLKLKMPVLGNINLLNGATQFATTMAALLMAGLPVHEATEITGKVMDNYVLGMDVSRLTGSLQEGKQLGECMKQCKYFPKTLVEMAAIGEETGEIENTLETIGAYYDNEASNATQKAISKLEPGILVVMAIFAGFIVISVYLPMFSMYDLM